MKVVPNGTTKCDGQISGSVDDLYVRTSGNYKDAEWVILNNFGSEEIVLTPDEAIELTRHILEATLRCKRIEDTRNRIAKG